MFNWRQIRFSAGWVVVILLAVFFGVSMYLRVALPYSQVFDGSLIKFNGTDAYFYLRQIDSLVYNFPHLNTFDPYLGYPTGSPVGSMNFFAYLVAGLIWIIGLGHPGQQLIDVVSAYFPAVVAALTVVPVYFIGKTLFNRWAGVIAAGLMAILPGEFLGRSILSVTDRDPLEVLLAASTMLFFILAVKAAREKAPEIAEILRNFKWRNLAGLKSPLLYSLLSGIFISIFALTWRGAFIFVVIILAYAVIQSTLDHLRRRSFDYLAFTGLFTFFTALVLFGLSSRNLMYSAALAISLFLFLLLWGLSWFITHRELKPVFYPVSLAGAGLLSLGIFYAVRPSLLKTMLNQFSILFPSQNELTVSELQPILFPNGQFSFSIIWGNYSTGFFLSLIALGILIYLLIRRDENPNLLVILWSVVMLVGTLMIRRLALLYVINIALLTGYIGWQIIEFFNMRKSKPELVKPAKRARTKKEQKASQGFHPTGRWLTTGVAVIIVFFLVFFPNISPAVTLASQTPFAPSTAWVNSLTWLKDNSPEPFGSADFYYQTYKKPFQYPQTAYTVAAWWDYGYWIQRIGHRIPSDDPGGGAREQVAKMFTAQDEASADVVANQIDSKYVIIDNSTVTSKFYAVADFAGLNMQQFSDVYYNIIGNQAVPVVYYYPAFYQSLAVRLYYFDGKPVTPGNITVISFESKVSLEGIRYKQITGSQSFPNYADAQAFIAKQKTGNYVIASQDPTASPVPLAGLNNYKLVYPAVQAQTSGFSSLNPSVKIYEYSGLGAAQ